MKKALFLDRDGIINEDVGYPHKPEQIVFIPEFFTIAHDALKKGYLLIVVTNQAGIAKGYFSEDDVTKLHEWMKSELDKMGVFITAFYYSPFHPDAPLEQYRKKSPCRKPGPEMVLQAIREHGIDISKSLMIGDKNSDRIKIDGLRSVIVKSKYVATGYDIEKLTDIISLL